MLTAVAERTRRSFGPERTCRIGGDAFVAFRADEPPTRTLSEADRIRRDPEEQGYHVSFSMAARYRAEGDLNMRDLVREADHSAKEPGIFA